MPGGASTVRISQNFIFPKIDQKFGKKIVEENFINYLDLGGDQPEFLNYAKIPIMSKKDCQSKHTNEKDYESISDDMICAGFDHGGTDACNGDSGGPLMCTREDNTGLIFSDPKIFSNFPA